MRYIKGKVHFSKRELKVFERLNPTLFDLARYANATTKVHNNNYVTVACNEHPLCPTELFYVPNTAINKSDDFVELQCCNLHCWNQKATPDGKRPCWFRTWNDFVSDMKGV